MQYHKCATYIPIYFISLCLILLAKYSFETVIEDNLQSSR